MLLSTSLETYTVASGAISQKRRTRLSFSSEAPPARSTADLLGRPPNQRPSATGEPVGTRPSRSTHDNTHGNSTTRVLPLKSMTVALADTRARPICPPRILDFTS